jgi:hypothetical protein
MVELTRGADGLQIAEPSKIAGDRSGIAQILRLPNKPLAIVVKDEALDANNLSNLRLTCRHIKLFRSVESPDIRRTAHRIYS